MPKFLATSAARSPSREAIASTTPCSPLIIAGITRLMPILAVLRIPHLIFFMLLLPDLGVGLGELQVPPLRYAPVGMTRLAFDFIRGNICLCIATTINLSSRPERSVVEGPAV